MTIIGQSQIGTIINGTDTNWIFYIPPGISVSLYNITLTNGYGSSGGAISNVGNLMVTNCTFNNNTSYRGGAISYRYYASGSMTLTITESTFTNNTASDRGGAIYNYNMGYGTAICTITESTFTNNTASDRGGAISNLNFGSFLISNVSFSRFYNNTATICGNGIDNAYCSVNAENNWWGSNNPDFNSLLNGLSPPTYWLFMTTNATPETINNTQPSTVTVSFNNHSSDGSTYTTIDSANGHIPDGVPVTFSLIGDILGVLDEPMTVTTTNGTASIMFTANSAGVQQINATTDNQNVTATVTINPASYVEITKVFMDLPWGNVITTAYYNDKIYAIVKVHNSGPDSTTSVNILDLLDGLTWTGNYYVYRTVGSYPNTESAWVFNDPDYLFNGTDWNVGSLATMIGSSRWLAIEVIVNQTGTVSNYAKTMHQSTSPYKGYANYTAYLTSNITLTLVTVDDVRGDKGDTVTLEAVLKDYLGNALTGKTVEFWIDNIKIGENTTDSNGTGLFTYVISQTPGNHILTSIFNETARYQGCNATGNLYVPRADLYIQITSDKNNPRVGEIFTLTYKLGNNGPDDAENVTITIPIPEGFIISEIKGDGTWTQNGNTITWTFNNVTVGDPYLYIHGWTTAAGNHIFTASINSNTFNLNSRGVNSLSINAQPQVNAATTNTIGMQNTGIPLPGMVLAILMVLGGFIGTRKKQ